MSRASVHTCHALRCDADVPPRMHMCRKHWAMVPRAKQRALWAAYKPGQERTLTPSIDYLHAAGACVRSVAEREGWPEREIAEEVDLYLGWARMLGDEQTEQLELLTDEGARPWS